MKCCPEAQTLRTFVPGPLRDRMVDKLMVRYSDGRRCASHIVQALDASFAQARHSECRETWLRAVHAVRPVPRVLHDWARRHRHIFNRLAWLTH